MLQQNSTTVENVKPVGVLDQALACAAEGLPVFFLHGIGPTGKCTCNEPDCDTDAGKHPIAGTRWSHDATTDQAELRRRWDAFESAAPWLNYGIAVPDGLAVIDVDPRNDGDVTLAALESAPDLGAFPRDRVAQSGSGDGRHIWLRLPTGKRLEGSLGPGIDVKQLGGYVVGPGSRHASGGTYSWASLGPVPHAPHWLTAASTTRQQVERNDPGPGTDVDLDQIEALAKLLEPLCIPGQRHHVCWEIGSWLSQRGWSKDSVAALVRQLPSNDPEGRVSKSAWPGMAYQGGYTRLRGRVEAQGQGSWETLERAAPNPKWDAAQSERTEIAALVADAAAKVPAPAASAPSFLRIVADSADNEELYRRLVEPGFDLARGCTTGIQAPPRRGKTPLMFQLLFSVANGGTFLGLQCQRGKAAMLTWEKVAATKARKATVAKAIGVDPSSVTLVSVAKPLTLDSAPEVAEFVRAQEFDVIALDTLNSAMGSSDQNEMGAAAPLKVLSQALPDVAIVAAVYEKKSAGEDSDLSNVAGSGAIAGAFDAMVRLKLEKGSKTRYTIESTRELTTEPKPIEIEAAGDEASMCFRVVSEVDTLAESLAKGARRGETQEQLQDRAMALCSDYVAGMKAGEVVTEQQLRTAARMAKNDTRNRKAIKWVASELCRDGALEPCSVKATYFKSSESARQKRLEEAQRDQGWHAQVDSGQWQTSGVVVPPWSPAQESNCSPVADTPIG